MVKMFHVTSPSIAIRVARTQRFVGGPIDADDGLNAYIDDHCGGPYFKSEISNTGAILEFEWTGPQERAGNFHAPNILHDQHPHRAFVAAGTKDHLYLTGIRLADEQDWTDGSWLCSLRPSNGPNWLQSKLLNWNFRETARIKSKVLGLVQKRPKILVVSGL